MIMSFAKLCQEVVCLLIDILIVFFTFLIDSLSWLECVINPENNIRIVLRDYDPNIDDIPSEEK